MWQLGLFLMLLVALNGLAAAATGDVRLDTCWEYHQGTPGSVWEIWRGDKAIDNVTSSPVTLPHYFNSRVATIERARILKAADAALNLEPITITKYHSSLSQGGTNDFYSNAAYFWPDPAKPDGIPYINRDGESNPDNFWQHRMAMRDLRDAVAALAAAYKITGNDRYATKAARLLRVFFLDPKTQMNPNLQYAQAVPGSSSGRSWGIIDGLHLIEIPPTITTMEKSPVFAR